MASEYDDIIRLPHHVSLRHAPMPMEKRAAQFAPFSALSGFEEAIEEVSQAVPYSFDDNYRQIFDDTENAIDVDLLY